MSKKERVRPEILDFDPYVPGLGLDEIREKYGLDRVVKLASNENPLGVSPIVQKRLAQKAQWCHRYPANHSPRLRAALAELHGVAPERILVGNGSDECIDLLFRVVCTPGKDHVLGYAHAFSMYRLEAKLCGVEYRELPREAGYALPLAAMAKAADADTAMVFVTSPDNPTGLTASPRAQAELARSLPEGALLVVDEAYGEFAGADTEASLIRRAAEFDNLVVLRTFSKAYGLAGLRLGYMVAPPWLVSHCTRARIPFTVNLLAEDAGLAALEDTYFLQATLETVAQGREQLTAALTATGCEVLPSKANFVFVTPPASETRDAKALCEELLKRGAIVRPLGSFGLPRAMRVSVGKKEENDFFLEAFREVLNG